MTSKSEPAAPDPANQCIPAATLVIFRKGADGNNSELLMVTRSRGMAFASGAAVFPGGRVDAADRELAVALGLADSEEGAHRIAAVRETLEETGLALGIEGEISAQDAQKARSLLFEQKALAPVLDQMGWNLALEKLLPFARWFPKNERIPRVFDTRFYIYDIGTGAVDVSVDNTENTHLFWIGASDALRAADNGDLHVIFPTRRNLERLAQFTSFAEAVHDCEKYPVRTITPFLEERGGEPWLCIPQDAGYPIDGEPIESIRRG